MKINDDENRVVVFTTVADLKKFFLEINDGNKNHLKSVAEEKPIEVKKLVPRLTVAESYGICPETLDKWVKLKIFPQSIKKGGRKYFYQSDLDSFNTKPSSTNH